MKNHFPKVIVSFIFIFAGQANAQRSFFGIGYNSYILADKTFSGFDSDNNATYSGIVKSKLSDIGVYYSHYSGLRQGFTVGFAPVTQYVKNSRSYDGIFEKTNEYNGMTFRFGLFGLISTDYLSKLEFHLYNNFAYTTLSDKSFFTVDFGCSARYRINNYAKLALEFALFSNQSTITNGNFSSSCLGVKLFYSPFK